MLSIACFTTHGEVRVGVEYLADPGVKTVRVCLLGTILLLMIVCLSFVYMFVCLVVYVTCMVLLIAWFRVLISF